MWDDLFLKEADELLKKVIKENYDLNSEYHISPELRDEIEKHLNLLK